MSNTQHSQGKNFWFLSIFFMLLILIGIIISIVQIRHQNTVETDAHFVPRVTIMPSSAISEEASPTPSPINTPLPTATPRPNIPTPTPIEGFVAKPDDTQLYVSIKIIGIGTGGNARPKHLSRYVEVEIFNLDNKSVALGNGDLTYDGNNLFRGIVHLGKIENAKYYIKITGDSTLAKIVEPQFQQLTNTNLNILPSVTLIQGDVFADNIININDYNAVLPCFQDTKCQYRELIDLNDDGQTNAIDYNLLLFNFWEAQGD